MRKLLFKSHKTPKPADNAKAAAEVQILFVSKVRRNQTTVPASPAALRQYSKSGTSQPSFRAYK